MRSVNFTSWVPAMALVLGTFGLVAPAAATEKDNPAAENLYTKSYVSRNNLAVPLQPDPAGPKVYLGGEKDKDYQRMLEDGFDMLGYSSFEAAEDVSPDQLTEQARKVKADLVLVYTKLTGNVPASVKIQQMREQARKAEKTQDTNNRGVELPEEHALYSYFASYWVKLAPPLIGVHVTSSDQDDAVTGLKVFAVIKDSPAAKVALREGDILTRIGDVELTRPETLSQAAQRYAGQTVEIAWQRNGDANKAAITLNKRP